MFDIITFGGATQDTFLKSDCARIMSIETPEKKESYLSFSYGEKLEIDNLAYDIGGGATNAAVNLSNLGLKTGIVVKIGKDLSSQAVLERLDERKVDKSMVIQTDDYKTGFSTILTSYEGDRTVLMHRGANSQISLSDLDWEKIKQSKWVYVASLSGKSNEILDDITEFAEKNGINLAFNPGSTQLKKGLNSLQKILETAEILVLNRSEASAVTGIPNKPTGSLRRINDENLKEMIVKLKEQGPKVVVITEGKHGVFAYNGEYLYFAPPFCSKVISTLGAGDAFSSTFVATMIKTDWDVEKSLLMASINSASVIESFGAQQGLKTFEEMEEILKEEREEFVVSKKSLQLTTQE